MESVNKTAGKTACGSGDPASAHPPPPIDLAHFEYQTAGDHALQHELLALFAEQCVRHVAAIRHDPAARHDAAHSLKGAARAIGAWRIADVATLVEQAPPGPLDSALADDLCGATAEARAAITAMLKRSTD